MRGHAGHDDDAGTPAPSPRESSSRAPHRRRCSRAARASATRENTCLAVPPTPGKPEARRCTHFRPEPGRLNKAQSNTTNRARSVGGTDLEHPKKDQRGPHLARRQPPRLERQPAQFGQCRAHPTWGQRTVRPLEKDPAPTARRAASAARLMASPQPNGGERSAVTNERLSQVSATARAPASRLRASSSLVDQRELASARDTGRPPPSSASSR